MSLVKNYLRYCHDTTFGIIAASQTGGNIKYLTIGSDKTRFVGVPASENLYIWDTKLKKVVTELKNDSSKAAEITVFDYFCGGHLRTNLVAVGYASGQVRVFEYETGLLKSIFNGHKKSITTLSFDNQGTTIATGAKDGTLVLWDLFSERGIFSLKAHNSVVYKIGFIRDDEYQKNILISTSLDSLKFWEIETGCCFATIPKPTRTFVILQKQGRLICGYDTELRVHSIQFVAQPAEHQDNLGSSSEEYGLKVQYLGNIMRYPDTGTISDMIIDRDESMIVGISGTAVIEFYGLRNESEAQKYGKKLIKKANKKAKKALETEKSEEDIKSEIVITNNLEERGPQFQLDCEINRKFRAFKLDDPVRSLDIHRDSNGNWDVALMTRRNSIELYKFEPEETKISKENTIGNTSHKSDIRAVAITDDNSLIMSACSESINIWSLQTCNCLTSIKVAKTVSCTFANCQNIFCPTFDGNRLALIGSSDGKLSIIDINSSEILNTIRLDDRSKSVNSICVKPDRTGIIYGDSKGNVVSLSYLWEKPDDQDHDALRLTLEETLSQDLSEGITCVKISADNECVAIALLDRTVRVCYLDTFKQKFTLYGHKFPVLTMSISDDSRLIVTGSKDKSIMIWGMDFGDCHKRIHAHDDDITGVAFVPKTHHVFSCSKDRSIKQWDCDHFKRIQYLKKHQAAVNCLIVTPNGRCVVTASSDKSLRLYVKTEDILVPADEDEHEREVEDQEIVYNQQELPIIGENNKHIGLAPRMTYEIAESTDALMESIDIYKLELEKLRQYELAIERAKELNQQPPPAIEHDPRVGVVYSGNHNRFMLDQLRRIRNCDLEQTMLFLPFHYVPELFEIYLSFLKQDVEPELMIRHSSVLLKLNYNQISSSPSLMSLALRIREVILKQSLKLRDLVGYNNTSLNYLS